VDSESVVSIKMIYEHVLQRIDASEEVIWKEKCYGHRVTIFSEFSMVVFFLLGCIIKESIEMKYKQT
jgi:hypothetical protein